MHSTRRSGAAWPGGKAERYHSRSHGHPRNVPKGAEIGALRKGFLQNPHQAKRQETVRRSMEMVGIKRGQSTANLWAELPRVPGARYNLREWLKYSSQKSERDNRVGSFSMKNKG